MSIQEAQQRIDEITGLANAEDRDLTQAEAQECDELVDAIYALAD